MVIITKLLINITQHSLQGKNISDLSMYGCKNCGYYGRLHRHGHYSRMVITLFQCFSIDIQRFKCPTCGKTFSNIPCFLIPYFRYSFDFILFSIYHFFKTSSSLPFLTTLLGDFNPACYITKQSLIYFIKRFKLRLSLTNSFLAGIHGLQYDMDISNLSMNAVVSTVITKVFRYNVLEGSFNHAYFRSMDRYFFSPASS